MGMHQPSLLHDTLEDALSDVVYALGGPKAVAAELWPGKNPQEGGRHLSHCLTEDRAEKLALGELVWILQEGAKADCHVAMHYLNRQCGYQEPELINPEDEKAKLRREFNSNVEKLSTLAERIKRLG